jgi:hypothetical protein
MGLKTPPEPVSQCSVSELGEKSDGERGGDELRGRDQSTDQLRNSLKDVILQLPQKARDVAHPPDLIAGIRVDRHLSQARSQTRAGST